MNQNLEEYYKIMLAFIKEKGKDHWLSKDLQKIINKNKEPPKWVITELQKKNLIPKEEPKVNEEKIEETSKKVGAISRPICRFCRAEHEIDYELKKCLHCGKPFEPRKKKGGTDGKETKSD